jgi:hypothetical protein
MRFDAGQHPLQHENPREKPYPQPTVRTDWSGAINAQRAVNLDDP